MFAIFLNPSVSLLNSISEMEAAMGTMPVALVGGVLILLALVGLASFFEAVWLQGWQTTLPDIPSESPVETLLQEQQALLEENRRLRAELLATERELSRLHEANGWLESHLADESHARCEAEREVQDLSLMLFYKEEQVRKLEKPVVKRRKSQQWAAWA